MKIEPKNSNTIAGNLDRVIALLKWVDSPFKLFTIILLSLLVFAGYVFWDSKEFIKNSISISVKADKLKNYGGLLPVAKELLDDIDGTAVVINEINLPTNTRTTKFAIGKTGENKAFLNFNASVFSADEQKNSSVIAMLNGEVFCEYYVPEDTNLGRWHTEIGTTYVCRGSIPPEVGKLIGYTAVGFTKKPTDLIAVKTRINLMNSRMVE